MRISTVELLPKNIFFMEVKKIFKKNYSSDFHRLAKMQLTIGQFQKHLMNQKVLKDY